jgi:ubiquinone/menaquinone biosynthesis C-methylase UbiE
MKNEGAEFEKINLKNYLSSQAIEVFDKIGFLPVEKTIVKKYFTKKNANMIDIGCGMGRTTVPLSKMGFNVIGVDLSESLINKAKVKFSNIDFRIGNACDLKFSDDCFDYALFSFNGIDLIYPEKKREKALKEVNRVLKDEGIFIFSSHNPLQFLAHGFRGFISHWIWLLKFIVINITYQRLFLKYKIDNTRFGHCITYYITPSKQREQLENNGFKLLDVFGKFEGKIKYFEPWLYYVAQKREKSDY